MLGNSAFQLAASNTAKFIFVCIPLLLIISLVVALMLTTFQEKHGIFKTTFLMPMAIPVASIVLLWRVIFHRNGLINGLLSLLDVTSIDWIGSGAAFAVLVFAYIWKNFGYDMVLWLSGISAINPALYEAAANRRCGQHKTAYKDNAAQSVADIVHSHSAVPAQFVQGIQGSLSHCRQLSR